MSFLWGVATSGHQIDGNNIHSDWWAWEQKGNVEGGVRSGLAANHWKLFRDDLRLAKDLGIKSYRFSFEWSRIEPREGEWDDSAFAWYEEMIGECETLGIIPMATLHHFTSPAWFAEDGGFSNSKSVERFSKFAGKVAERFASRIPLWCTFNEPMVLVSGGYLARFMPPAEFRPDQAAKVCANLLASHVRAYDILSNYRSARIGKFSDLPLQIGFAHNMLSFRPERWFHPIEALLSWRLDCFYNRAWLDSVFGKKQRFGIPWLLPTAPEVKEARGRVTSDFVGVNYYTKALIHWRPRTAAVERGPEVPIGIAFAKRKEPTSDLGWSNYPAGFKDVLRRALSYGKPVFVTENGIADKTDEKRIDYLRAHLDVVAEMVGEGADIRGYYHWSLIDNFEWIKGFGPRFGLVHVDYDTFVRTPRKSAEYYRDLILAHDRRRPDRDLIG